MPTFALIGNQNCGKTTLFNQLTGSNQHVGNFPGVTVEKKEGVIKKHKDAVVVDLPGIYSLSPYTAEEVVTRDFLLKEKPDAVINICDATNIERNLYLTMQLIELNLPMVLALNMMDEVEANGTFIDVLKLEEELGIPVVPISAAKNDGVAELVEHILDAAKHKTLPKRLDFCRGAVHKAIHSIAHIVEDKAQKAGVPVRFAATKLVEGDAPMVKTLGLTESELDILGHITDDMEAALGTDREAALADMRYDYIESLVALTVTKSGQSREQERSIKIDSVLTNRFLAIPIFLGIMFLVFFLTFGVFGKVLSNLLEQGISAVTSLTDAGLSALGVNPMVHSLIIDGVFAGVGSVLSFLPIIVVLFFFLSILEDSGYMARVAFVMDKLLRKIGLSGRSFVPMLIGFGCSVPAIMATRTLSSDRDRKMTILLTPYMSCSAKIPIYAVFSAAFFPKYAAFVMIGLYALGIVLGILVALVLKGTLFQGKPVPFVMELPNYRFPSPRNVAILLWEKAWDFIRRAFTVIFTATILIWFLQTFDLRLNVVSNSADSILALVGRWIAPVFQPLGFGDWRAVTALISGFTAKEAVISTLGVLLGVGMDNLGPALGTLFTPLAAGSFLIFTLLYTPCVAAVATIRRELGSKLQTLGVVVMQCVVAWLAAGIFYQLGRLL